MTITAPQRSLLGRMLPRTQDHVLTAAERHGLEFLERLLIDRQQHGPDGKVIRNDFDLLVLTLLVDILREVEP